MTGDKVSAYLMQYIIVMVFHGERIVTHILSLFSRMNTFGENL